MRSTVFVASALAAALCAAAVTSLQAQQETEQCYGVAKAGQNDCANQAGTHSCAGQSKADMSLDDWKYVAAGTCKDMKGKTAAEIKAMKDGKKS